MPRVLRTTLPDGYFHAFSRAVFGTVLYRDSTDRRLFLKLLIGAAKRHGWEIQALCLMTTHYHVVLRATVMELAGGMHWLNGSYAQRFNKRHKRFGHLFSGRYGTKAIDSDDYLARACDYVLLNPVRAGLCARAADWPWSGSRSGFPDP
jgi:REP element-mobilizing transposase RayT